jgi:exopolyphosphatase/guanosine-5'-triphosphate,3'-diphosphate pyrophosphatase
VSHILNQDSIVKSIRTIIKYKVKCNEFNIKTILALGTSALRDARDSNHFLSTIKEKTGINVKVISGDEEAELTLNGIKGQNSFFNSPCSLIIDVGGGSTELIICHDRCTRISMPVGAIYLFERFIKNDPPTTSELNDIKEFIIAEFNPVISLMKDLKIPQPCGLIATGGTPVTLACIYLKLTSYDGDKVHGQILSYAVIKSMFEKLAGLQLEKRRSIPGMDHERADIILAGILIILTIMELFRLNELIVSDYGLLEGAILASADFS